MRGLTAARWRALAPMVERVRPRTGREFRDLRRAFAGVVFRLRTGLPWRDLPARFGPWQRAWSLHRRWARLGVWDALLAEARAAGRPDLVEVFVDGTTVRAHQKAAGTRGGSEALGRSRGGLTTKAVAAVEARGRLVALAPPLAGQRPNLDAAPGLLDALPPGRVRRVGGDRGLSAAWLRREVEARGAEPCLPAHPMHPPVPYDRAAYARRHRVENFWARMKEFRAVAARYDKTAAAFRAGILIAATLDWLKA